MNKENLQSYAPEIFFAYVCSAFSMQSAISFA
jgi:hypothetical protein